jgi:hypothetical protein
VLQEDRLRLENQLIDARRTERVAQRRYSEIEAISSDRLDKGRSLLSEAKQVGLITDEVDENNIVEILAVLQKTQSWKPKQVLVENIELSGQLRDEIQVLRQNLKEKSQQINIVEKYIADANGYTGEVGYQAQRLESINIFDDHDVDTCPLCQSDISSKNIPSVKVIKNTLGQLNSSLQIVRRERPKLEGYLKQLSVEREQLSLQIQEKKNELDAIENEEETSKSIKDENARTARVIGRISFYLEHLNISDELQPLRMELEKAQETVKFLENQLGPELLDERQTSILNLISYWMTEWAKVLKLEYSRDFHYQFDLKNLTVQANLPDRIVSMPNMGGGKNILGCHIITLFALHKYFVTQKRPVPGFIILDQPTQGFFLSEEAYKKIVDSGNSNQISQDDRENIQNLFNLIFEVCKQLAPNFQIIILEHSHLENNQYREALIEESWNRTERALIPPSWMEMEEE